MAHCRVLGRGAEVLRFDGFIFTWGFRIHVLWLRDWGFGLSAWGSGLEVEGAC